MDRYKGRWTVWSAGSGERPQQWVKCGEGGPDEFADMLRCLMVWQREGQRVRLEWSDTPE